jgi:hypothetical protein
VQEVAVVERLQAEVAELQVAPGLQCFSETGQVEPGELRLEQLGADAALDEGREVGRVPRLHVRLARLLAEHLETDRVEQQPRGHVAVGRVLLDQGARREHRGLAHFLHRHAVVQVAQRRFQDRLRGGVGEARARRLHQALQARAVERLALTVLDHVKFQRSLG